MLHAKSDTQTIRAAAHLKGIPFRCPHCHGEVRVRTGRNVSPHFYHLRDTCEMSRSDESGYHPLSNLLLLTHAETHALESLVRHMGKMSARMRGMMDALTFDGVTNHRKHLIEGLIASGWLLRGQTEWTGFSQMWYDYRIEPEIAELFTEPTIYRFDAFWKRIYAAFPKLLHFYETVEAAHEAAKETPFRLEGLPMRPMDTWRMERIREHLPVLRTWHERSLYVLKVTTKGRVVMKIGVSVDFETRLAALQSESELAMGAKTVLETVLVLPNRGYLEPFLKRRLADTRASADFTEYFSWNYDIILELQALK